MGLYSVIVPEAATNLVTNPSIEMVTTGWAAVGGSVARSSTRARRGSWSLAVTCTSATEDGVKYSSVSLTSGTTYYATVDIWGVVGIPYRFRFLTAGDEEKGTAASHTGIGDWQRITCYFTADASAAFNLSIQKWSSDSTALFYLDGLQVVSLGHDTTYLDGSLGDGYAWTGAEHLSTSTRTAQVRNAGRTYDLADLGFHTVEITGGGMATLENYMQERALLPGAEYGGFKVPSRTFLVTGDVVATSRADLHGKRKDVIDFIKPDLTAKPGAFLLKYTGANSTKSAFIECVYAGGLEMSNSYGYSERISMALTAPNPFWFEDGNDSKVIDGFMGTDISEYFDRRTGGDWIDMDATFNSDVYCAVVGPDNVISIGGSFTNIVDANGDYILKWTGTAWTTHKASTRGADSIVYAMAYDAAGNLWATGAFANIGGVAAAKIAYWNGTAWNACGTGLNDTGFCLALGTNGLMYVGGDFTTANGVTVNRVAYWNGTTFVALGATGVNNTVLGIAAQKNGNIWLAGAFTTATDSGATRTVNHATYWDGALFHVLGSAGLGTGGNAYCVAIDSGNRVWFGGDFTVAGGAIEADIARWNGAAWESVNAALDGVVRTITFDKNGLMYIGGAFTTAGGVDLSDAIAVFNGSTWAHLDVNLATSPTIWFILSHHPTDDLYICYNVAGAGACSDQTTVTNNGTTAAYPVIKMKRSGGTSSILEYIKNETNGATLWLNYSLADGETLTIDCRLGSRGVKSSYFGDRWNAVLRGSDLAKFKLEPGANVITAFFNESSANDVVATMEWKTTHWSLDGVAA